MEKENYITISLIMIIGVIVIVSIFVGIILYNSYNQEEDSDNEYYTETLNINGEEYKLIKVISTSKYSNKTKSYVYFFPLQKDNILYCLMAEIGEKNYNEENLDIVKKVFSSYCIL